MTQLPTAEMIEAGVREAHNQAHHTYADMCRAIYLVMQAARPDDGMVELADDQLERIWLAFNSFSVASSNETGEFRYYIHPMEDCDPFVKRDWRGEFTDRFAANKACAEMNVRAAIAALKSLPAGKEA